MLAAAGVGFRALAWSLNRSENAVPLPPGTLQRVPLRIDDWTGRDVPLDARIRRATHTDDLLNRRYVSGTTGDAVVLYVAYGTRARDLMPHRPEVCYTGAGWTQRSVEYVTLTTAEGRPLPCRILRFAQGGFDLGEVVVVNYYIVDDAYCPDETRLRARAAAGAGSIDYMAQVQVVASANALADIETCRLAAIRFAQASAEALRAVLRADGPTATAPGREDARP